jgi:hypothetical protein
MYHTDARAATWLGSNQSLVDHGSISGLGDVADHLLYLDLAGTRAMTGDLDMDANDILNAGHIGPDEDDTYDLGEVVSSPGGFNLEIQSTGFTSMDTVTSTTWSGQTFQTSGAFDIGKVSFIMKRTAPASGNITMHLRATSLGKPSGADLASVTIDGSTITTDGAGEWIDFILDTPYSLSSSTYYAIVLSAVSGGETFGMGFWFGGAVNGSYTNSVNSGATWTNNTGIETTFKVYSSGAPTLDYTNWRNLYLAGLLSDGTYSLTVQQAQAAYDHSLLTDEHIDWKAATDNFLTSGTGQFGGSVGIGTAASDLLHIKGSSPVMKIENTSVTLRPAFFLQHVDGDRAGFFYYDKSYGGDTDLQGDLVIHLDNVGDVIYQNIANVGINITTPPTTLSVDGGISMVERADHETVEAASGQLWVKNTDPCELWFTDDAGNDTKIV